MRDGGGVGAAGGGSVLGAVGGAADRRAALAGRGGGAEALSDADPRHEAIRYFAEDRWQAHQIIFPHRHPAAPAEFHPELVEDFWSDDPYSIRLAFRGSAKSTLGEEDITLAVCYRIFHNILIIGASEARAAERLAVVSYELVNNEFLISMFGEQKAEPWTQTKLVTTSNICVQAIGRDQDIRGIKHLDWRPDFIFVDDFEDKDTVQTPEGRRKTLRWFLAELLPACAPQRRVRVRATPMDAESVPMRLINEAGWPSKTYGIEYLDEGNRRRSSWPALFPLDWIDRERRIYEAVGELAVWQREMMCQAISDADRPFLKEMIRLEPRQRTYEAVYAMIDPARSVGRDSAATGYAVWSWVQNRLIVWAAEALFLAPDEIVALGFDIAEKFDPIWVQFEQDGLVQWLLQPIRQEQIRRGHTIPYRGVGAISGTRGQGQTQFIRGLQPFFAAREVIFAQPLPALESQLLNFPTGRRDTANALAYAPMTRPAAPIYDGFTTEHIVADLALAAGKPVFLAANATGAITAAVLVQAFEGTLRILADWVFEGPPAERVADIYEEAALFGDTSRMVAVPARSRGWDEMLKTALPEDRLVARRLAPVWIVPPHHAERYTNVGLMQAVRGLPAEVRPGGEQIAGSLHLRDLLSRTVRGMPAVEIGAGARWTLRALAGGYTRAMIRGRLQDAAEEGPYRVLMEGLEAFAAIIRTGATDDKEDDAEQNFRYDARTGKRYVSAMPQARAR